MMTVSFRWVDAWIDHRRVIYASTWLNTKVVAAGRPCRYWCSSSRSTTPAMPLVLSHL